MVTKSPARRRAFSFLFWGPPQLAASFSWAIIGIGIGNSSCWAKPNRCAIFLSYSHLSADDSAISSTRPKCLPSARAPISFKN